MAEGLSVLASYQFHVRFPVSHCEIKATSTIKKNKTLDDNEAMTFNELVHSSKYFYCPLTMIMHSLLNWYLKYFQLFLDPCPFQNAVEAFRSLNVSGDFWMISVSLPYEFCKNFNTLPGWALTSWSTALPDPQLPYMKCHLRWTNRVLLSSVASDQLGLNSKIKLFIAHPSGPEQHYRNILPRIFACDWTTCLQPKNLSRKCECPREKAEISSQI